MLSTFSYLVDFRPPRAICQGYLPGLFALVAHSRADVKAGLIVAVFMHIASERLALIYAILVPPAAVLVFLGIMVFESNCTVLTRVLCFGTDTP